MGIIDANVTDREKLEKALIKKDREDFIREVKDLSPVDLEKRLMNLAKANELILKEQANDEKLNEAKELVANLNGPYSDSLNANKLLRKYIGVLLDETGNLG